jgi:hypothetical protein
VGAPPVLGAKSACHACGACAAGGAAPPGATRVVNSSELRDQRLRGVLKVYKRADSFRLQSCPPYTRHAAPLAGALQRQLAHQDL